MTSKKINRKVQSVKCSIASSPVSSVKGLNITATRKTRVLDAELNKSSNDIYMYIYTTFTMTKDRTETEKDSKKPGSRATVPYLLFCLVVICIYILNHSFERAFFS